MTPEREALKKLVDQAKTLARIIARTPACAGTKEYAEAWRVIIDAERVLQDPVKPLCPPDWTKCQYLHCREVGVPCTQALDPVNEKALQAWMAKWCVSRTSRCFCSYAGQRTCPNEGRPDCPALKEMP